MMCALVHLYRPCGRCFEGSQGLQKRHTKELESEARLQSDLETRLLGSRASGGDVRHGRKIERKSTRLNSSHTVTSYAVFCLKQKSLPAQPVATAPAFLAQLGAESHGLIACTDKTGITAKSASR